MDRRTACLRGAMARSFLVLLLAVAPACDPDQGALEPTLVAVDPSVWVRQDEVLAEDGASQDRFGDPVALWKDTLVIGKPNSAYSVGSVYVFARSGAKWAQQAKLPTPLEAKTGLGGRLDVF